jgi:hypothetical protein
MNPQDSIELRGRAVVHLVKEVQVVARLVPRVHQLVELEQNVVRWRCSRERIVAPTHDASHIVAARAATAQEEAVMRALAIGSWTPHRRTCSSDTTASSDQEKATTLARAQAAQETFTPKVLSAVAMTPRWIAQWIAHVASKASVSNVCRPMRL